MRIRHQILSFLHEKVFGHDKGRERNKFTNLIYAILMPICYLSERNTMLRYDWNRDVFIIDKMEFSHEFLRQLYHNYKELESKDKELEIPFFNKQKREETMKSNIGIARVCHEANRQYCIDNELPVGPVWDEAPGNIQSSVIAGVKQVIADPKVTAAKMHDYWMSYKASEGWKFGKLNIKEKLHPNMVPFNKLPKVEQAKDKLFIRTVKAELKK